jgi:energy-converting hydrogenase B subunit D
VKALVYASLLLVAIAGGCVVLTRSPRRQVLAMSMNGLALTILFMVLQAPDVAFSELVVGVAALPLMFLAAIASTRMDRTPRSDAQNIDEEAQ